MRGVLLALIFFAVLTASAQTPRTFTVHVQESVTLQIVGSTAAYVVDPDIADAGAHSGSVTLTGRSAGRTQLVVVTFAGQSTFDIVVEGRHSELAQPAKRGGTEGRIETRYASASRQVQNTVDITREQRNRRTELHVENVNYGRAMGERAASTLPAVSYRIFTQKREVTLFDRLVDHSPLTASSTTVRGIHLIDEHWRVHAGTTTYTAYQSFLLPRKRETVFAAAYSVPLNARTRMTPGVFVYPGRGSVASLLFDYERSEALAARAELGYSNGLASSLQLRFDGTRDRVRIDLRYTPRDFATLNLGQTRGLYADASWGKTFAGGSTIESSLSSSDFDFLDGRALTATSNGRLRINESLSLLGGASSGELGPTRTITIPAGVQLDFARFGMSAVARWSQSSATNRGGAGFRVSGRASAGRLFATAYVDHQKLAPTLALIFRERPDLALALEQLGITATTPADIARALRENSALVELGFIEGVTVDLAPSRTQAGFELAWLGARASRPQLRLRVLANRTESVATHSDSLIATLTGSRRVTDSIDVFASYSWWLTQRGGAPGVVQAFVEAGVRHRFDHLPSLLPASRGSIRGSVFLDEDLDGVPDGTFAGAIIELDGQRTTETAPNGSFAFQGIEAGTHRVVARIPNAPDAFFTTPSRVEAERGDTVHFGVALAPARLFGTVVSDAGDPVPSAGVALTRGAKRLATTSASDGTFSFTASPGEWELSIDASRLPSGYSIVAPPRNVILERTKPVNVALSVLANRSISGVAPAGVKAIVVSNGLRVPVDADGRFAIRALPAGDVTLRTPDGSIARRVTVPQQPVALRIDLH